MISVEENLPLFKLDYGLMEQILYNLIYNAAQYTPKGVKIQIEVKYEVDTDYDLHMDVIKKCIITIKDDGYGFPEAEIDKAFDKFYRLQNSKTGGFPRQKGCLAAVRQHAGRGFTRLAQESRHENHRQRRRRSSGAAGEPGPAYPVLEKAT